jgi:hypothetical protein
VTPVIPCTTDVAPVAPVGPPPVTEYDAVIPDNTKDAVAADDPVNANDDVNVLSGKCLNIVLLYKYQKLNLVLYF